ncbi:uncharacterized protein GIQ15_01211 [Arthroderma uncinatum]|uniref:uncharacterized protein n=1 Tax=Arthroderma uncinatum TaxID=74035 RepID=UPI00144A9FB5|nr:uncharacterized protein GIQ15_01211 [Arthroderma uncinatum]KAF3491694.1 hypothetical protein GIQ15_01211 [Arthroderma uncinatum]
MGFDIATPLTLRCGITLPNRLVKAAMAERLAARDGLPGNDECLAAYRKWASGGWGLIITGNVQVDPAYLGGNGDISVSSSLSKEQLLKWKLWAEACSGKGSKTIVQINHPGRQSPFTKGIAPSAIALDIGKGIVPWMVNSFVFGTPREMTEEDIQDVKRKFVTAALLVAEAGFAGIEIHAAHGYLLAQFLSPNSNKRVDKYGGSALGRARFVVEIIQSIREVVPRRFCVGIKINSADYGTPADMDDCIQQMQVICSTEIDFLEISGGSFENPTFNTGPVHEQAASNKIREAFFIDFAAAIRSKIPGVPLLVTGGFRTRRAMEASIRDGSCDLIGIARPAVLNPELPLAILLNPAIPEPEAIAHAIRLEASSFARYIGIKAIGAGAETGWYTKQIRQMGTIQGSILITGSNGSLGSSIVQRILSHSELRRNYHGLYTVSKPERVSNINRVLKQAKSTGHASEIVTLDLSSLESVRKVAEDINRRIANGSLAPIRALILNAAWQEQTTQTFTRDGFDMTFQATYLSHLLLVLLLLRSMNKSCGRIVVLSSWAHDTAHPNNRLGNFANVYKDEKYHQIFNDIGDIENLAKGKWGLETENSGNTHAGIRRYGAAKLCQVMMFRELSERLAGDKELSGVSVLAVDPAAMPSDLTRRDTWVRRILIGKIILRIISFFSVLLWPNGPFRTAWKSAGDVLHAAFDTKSLGHHPSGVYLNGSEVSDVSLEARDRRKARQLWRKSVRYLQLEEARIFS